MTAIQEKLLYLLCACVVRKKTNNEKDIKILRFLFHQSQGQF